MTPDNFQIIWRSNIINNNFVISEKTRVLKSEGTIPKLNLHSVSSFVI